MTGAATGPPTATGPTAASAPPREVVLALGSNLGDRLANLQAGIDALAASGGITAVAVSGVFETSPVGGPDQPDYLNAVLLAVSGLPAMAVLDRCQAAEQARGRVRTLRWGPRTLDIDIIACGDEVSDDPVLTLPHPRAHQRAFVLVPWHDADPDASLPGYGSVAGLLARTGQDGVRRRSDLSLAAGRQAAANQGG
jgi:2-amino-4-hydroxy-6-hydroxymethyldihydropteridine diphosphokinase